MSKNYDADVTATPRQRLEEALTLNAKQLESWPEQVKRLACTSFRFVEVVRLRGRNGRSLMGVKGRKQPTR